MFTISCESCGKQYNIDETKLTKDTVRIKCKACSGVMVITKPAASEPVADIPVDSPPAPAATVDQTVQQGAAPAKEQKVRFGLFPKIIIVMLMISLGPLGIFFTTTLQETNQRIRANTEALMKQTAIGLNNEVDQWLDKNLRVLKTAASIPAVVSMDADRQEEVLKAIQAEYPWIYLAFTVGPDGMNLARGDGKALRDYSDRQYYKDIIGGKELTWQTLIGKTSKKPALVIAVPIRSGDTILGVMAAAMTTDTISQSVAAWKQGATGFAFLVDEKGKVVAHQIKEYVIKERNLSKDPLVSAFTKARTPRAMEFKNQKGQDSIGYIIGNQYGWALAIQQDKKEVFAALEDLQMFVYILLGSTIVVVLIIAWLSARTIVLPISKLTVAADKMSLGDLNVDLAVKSKDEIGLLAQSIGRMQTSLRLAMNRLRKRR